MGCASWFPAKMFPRKPIDQASGPSCADTYWRSQESFLWVISIDLSLNGKLLASGQSLGSRDGTNRHGLDDGYEL